MRRRIKKLKDQDYGLIIIQVPNIRISSTSEAIIGDQNVSPGPKSADCRGQGEEQDSTEERLKTCNYKTETCVCNKKGTAKSKHRDYHVHIQPYTHC